MVSGQTKHEIRQNLRQGEDLAGYYGLIQGLFLAGNTYV